MEEMEETIQNWEIKYAGKQMIGYVGHSEGGLWCRYVHSNLRIHRVRLNSAVRIQETPDQLITDVVVYGEPVFLGTIDIFANGYDRKPFYTEPDNPEFSMLERHGVQAAIKNLENENWKTLETKSLQYKSNEEVSYIISLKNIESKICCIPVSIP